MYSCIYFLCLGICALFLQSWVAHYGCLITFYCFVFFNQSSGTVDQLGSNSLFGRTNVTNKADCDSSLHCISLLSCRSVSQELSETILTMAANCSNVMNKARQPPPGVMPKGRAPSTSSLDAISPVQVLLGWESFAPLSWLSYWEKSRVDIHRSLGNTLLPLPQMDPLSGMASLNLGGTATSHAQSMQGFPTSLSSAFSNPQSPAKAFPPLPNPNPSTPFGGIGSLSSQLPGMDSGTYAILLFLHLRWESKACVETKLATVSHCTSTAGFRDALWGQDLHLRTAKFKVYFYRCWNLFWRPRIHLMIRHVAF